MVDPEDLLISAAEYGDLPTVRHLVEQGTDVNTDGGMPILLAVENGHLDVVRCLVEHGADVNAMEGAILVRAAMEGHMGIVVCLVEYGAIVDMLSYSSDDDVATALIAAVGEGHIDISAYLIRQGADVNALGGHALNIAVQSGHLEMVRCLVEHGANVNPPLDTGSLTPLSCAAEKGHFKIVVYLISQGADVHAQNNYAISNTSSPEVIDYLLSQGADLNAGATMIVAKVCRSGNADILRHYILQGLNIRNVLRSCSSILKKEFILGAATLKDACMVKLLLTLDRSIDTEDLLSTAAAKGSFSVVRALLSLGIGSATETRIALTAAYDTGHTMVGDIVSEMRTDQPPSEESRMIRDVFSAKLGNNLASLIAHY